MENKESCVPHSEIRIPMPWGHIAGRWYGDQRERPILAVHGWQDNCGTFAKLAPLIAPYRSVLCVDLPGHGRSSHLPAGVMYNNLEYVRSILRIMRAYKWAKVSLMGHSMGGAVAFNFSAIYPDRVDMLITLDIIKYRFVKPSVEPAVIGAIVEKSLTYNDRLVADLQTEPPAYTFSECEHLLFEGSQQSIELENCKYILERNITKSELFPDKYFFSRDNRLKLLAVFNPSWELSQEMARRICKKGLPMLVIKGGRSTIESAKPTQMDDYLAQNNRNFELHVCPMGTHHLHLNTPKPVAQLIIGFLLKHGDKANL